MRRFIAALGLRRSRFLLVRRPAMNTRRDQRKVAPRPTKAAINRRTPKAGAAAQRTILERCRTTEHTWTYRAVDEEATQKLGIALAKALPRPAVVALSGTLGAGKTRLVQAMAPGIGIDPGQVTSPTFVLLHEYVGDSPLFHFDAYRLTSDEEFWQLGAEEYLYGRTGGIAVIEWAERVAACLPRERLDISIAVAGPTERQFDVTAHGEPYQQALERLIAGVG
ncbi:MAG TPA: tRNA (adenosine(37)-N6)-threonylcarbamoyltransferase complex ATPase subunit type 1 TsaE [Pirellulales bacterium]|nr:tRNA (adenosine(37)-N6)-threonylcarbamoyltransferase complex ATPase subunit type 1 TsaE [Pirellulales bacterium]